MSSQSQLSYQQGGMVNSFQVLMMNLDSPAKLIYGALLILVIVYSPINLCGLTSWTNFWSSNRVRCH